MESNEKRQISLLARIILFIGLPIIAIYGITSLFTLYNVNTSISAMSEQQLESESLAAASAIDGALGKYMETTNQMALNSQYTALVEEITPGMDPTSAPDYAVVIETLSSIKAEDSNILNAYIADGDPNMLILSDDGIYQSDDWVMTARPWFQEMLANGGTTITEPYIDAMTGKMVVTVATPIYRPGTSEVFSAGGLDFTLDSISEIMSQYTLGDTGFFMLISSEGTIIYHPDENYSNTMINDSDMSDEIKTAIINQQTGPVDYSLADGTLIHGYAEPVGSTGWTVVTSLPDAEYSQSYNFLKMMSLFIMLLVIGIAALLIYFTAKKITAPINQLADVANRMAEGDVEAGTDHINSISRETTDLTQAFERMSANIRDHAISAQRIAEGDLTQEVAISSDKDLLGLSMTDMVHSLREMVKEVQMLSESTLEGQLSVRGNTGTLKGAYRDIIAGLNQSLDAVIEPLKTSSAYIEKIGKGEIPEKITEEAKGEFAEITNSINSCIDGLDALTQGNRVLSHIQGNDYSQRIEAEYAGIYGEISKHINTICDQLLYMLEGVNEMANGDFKKLPELKAIGKFSDNDQMVPAFINMMENIEMLVEEADGMANAAINGDLANRGDVSRFPGQYSKVIGGFNNTLDAITEPIQEASAVLNELSQGHLSTKMTGNYLGQNNQIKDDLNKTLDFLKFYINDISEILNLASDGDLSNEITSDYIGDFDAIKTAINHIAENLSAVLGEITNAAAQVESGSRQISDGAQALAQGTTEQASSIEELSASIEEVSKETRFNAQKSAEANDRTLEVRLAAEKGNRQMADMVEAMGAINESSNNISKIIRVIDDIAFQTNILALNAAVEAARAGQHGKGFAVVAEEVRSLAARSAEAASETTALIEGSISKVEDGTKIANDTADGLKTIFDSIEKVTSLIGDISKSSNDQATSIAQITTGIEQVTQVVHTNSATSEQSAASSEELSSQAEMLKNMVSGFKLRSSSSRQPRKKENLDTSSFSMDSLDIEAVDEDNFTIDLDDESDKY
ncbi:methyl-accepting chemotaxis protein [Eubacteriaceae bacterium ES3]|nr:methyl-accepting chemotaxis protein [Eubacteriaceae bacterium ES3]